MSATPYEDLQRAVVDALLADGDVAAIVGTNIFDGRPGEAYPCITIGPSDYQPDDMDGISAREQALQLDCWVRDPKGRTRPAAALADRVKAALHDAGLALDSHALALLKVAAVRVMLDADGATGHGVVSLEAIIEER